MTCEGVSQQVDNDSTDGLSSPHLISLPPDSTSLHITQKEKTETDFSHSIAWSCARFCMWTGRHGVCSKRRTHDSRISKTMVPEIEDKIKNSIQPDMVVPSYNHQNQAGWVPWAQGQLDHTMNSRPAWNVARPCLNMHVCTPEKHGSIHSADVHMRKGQRIFSILSWSSILSRLKLLSSKLQNGPELHLLFYFRYIYFRAKYFYDNT